MSWNIFENYVMEVYGEETDFLTNFALKQVVQEMKPIYAKLSRKNKSV